MADKANTVGGRRDHDLLEVLKLRQNLNEPISCNISHWRDARYQPRGYLRKIAESGGVSEIGLGIFSGSFKCLENHTIAGSGTIHRSEVLKLGAMYREGNVSATDLFLATMVWGNGGTGYGAYRTSVALNIPRKGAVPINVIETVGRLACAGDIENAYNTMANALWRIGPAFGTKFLYFASPLDNQALIFDGVVARWHSADSPWPALASSAWSWNWETYSAYMGWCQRSFNALPSELKETGNPSFHHDGASRADMVEAAIFSYMNSR